MKFGSLQVRTPDGVAREFPIDLPSLVVGRADGNGIVIDDLSISRRHARIEWSGGQCLLTDFSSNGTWVRLAGAAQALMLRRDGIMLYGEGEIALGAPPDDVTVPTLRFCVID